MHQLWGQATAAETESATRADNNQPIIGSDSGYNGGRGGTQRGGNGGGGCCGSATAAWGAMTTNDNGRCDRLSLNDIVCVWWQGLHVTTFVGTWRLTDAASDSNSGCQCLMAAGTCIGHQGLTVAMIHDDGGTIDSSVWWWQQTMVVVSRGVWSRQQFKPWWVVVAVVNAANDDNKNSIEKQLQHRPQQHQRQRWQQQQQQRQQQWQQDGNYNKFGLGKSSNDGGKLAEIATGTTMTMTITMTAMVTAPANDDNVEGSVGGGGGNGDGNKDNGDISNGGGHRQSLSLRGQKVTPLTSS
jgi:hypothetical protein